VIHRDLKPNNVLLLSGTGEPEVRLLDFGIARVLSELVGENQAQEQTLTQTAAVLGTPGYLSPEQARGQRDAIGPHTDVFALGAIAYLALTGRRAFPARTADGAIYEALYGEPVPASQQRASLPVAVDEVLALALAKDPARRYQKASELATDLRAAVEGRLPAPVSSRARALRQAG
jgi:serine/threonine protein kinase